MISCSNGFLLLLLLLDGNRDASCFCSTATQEFISQKSVKNSTEKHQVKFRHLLCINRFLAKTSKNWRKRMKTRV